MKVEIATQQVEFVVSGQTMAQFDFFELEQIVGESFKAEKADSSFNATGNIRSWMMQRGLPETVTESMVSLWLSAYYREMDKEVKKMTGPLN